MQSIISNSSPQDRLKNVIRGHLKLNFGDKRLGGVSSFELKNLSPKLRKLYIPLRDKYEHFFTETLQQAMSAGQIKQGNVQVQARILLGALNSVNQWFNEDESLCIGEVGDEICSIFYCDKSQDKQYT
jgi:hypothetical protein